MLVLKLGHTRDVASQVFIVVEMESKHFVFKDIMVMGLETPKIHVLVNVLKVTFSCKIKNFMIKYLLTFITTN